MFAVSAGLGFPRKVIKSSEGGGGGVKSEELLKWMSRDGITFWIFSLSWLNPQQIRRGRETASPSGQGQSLRLQDLQSCCWWRLVTPCNSRPTEIDCPWYGGNKKHRLVTRLLAPTVVCERFRWYFALVSGSATNRTSRTERKSVSYRYRAHPPVVRRNSV